jgi:hypothetical protein
MVSPIEVAFCVGLVTRGVDTLPRVRALIGVSEAEEMELRKFLDLAVVERLLVDRREISRAFEHAIKEIERSRNKKQRRLSRNVRKCPLREAKANSVSCSL